MDTDVKVSLILERLNDRLHDARVDYQCHAGTHEFLVLYSGSRFMIRFREHALVRKSTQEIELAVAQIIDRVRRSITPNATNARVSAAVG